MFFSQYSRRAMIVTLVAMALIMLVGCGGQSTPSAGPQDTPVPVTEEATATEASVPTPEATTSDTEASAIEAAPSDDGGQPSASRARIQLVPAGDGSSIQIMVDDVSELYALDLEIQFDAAKYQVADANPDMDGIQITPGEAPAPDFVAVNSVDNEAGVIHYVVTQLGGEDAFSGKGVVATIEWQPGVTWQGNSDAAGEVSFGTVTLVNKDVEQIEVTAN